MSAPQAIAETTRLSTAARVCCLLLALACGWLTVHLLGAWLLGTTFFPQAAPRTDDWGWPGPLVAAFASLACLQWHSGRARLLFSADPPRVIVEQQWFVGSSQRVFAANGIRGVRVASNGVGAQRWCLELQLVNSEWQSVFNLRTAAAAQVAAEQLAALLNLPSVASKR